jgi:hypothetical protein
VRRWFMTLCRSGGHADTLREVAKIRESATSVGSHQVLDHAMDGRPVPDLGGGGLLGG